MLIIPAIDIKEGCVVRFVQGKRDKKIYSSSPVKTARHWLRQGAKLIHIVDLDGAATGRPKNLDIVRDIAENVDVPLQFGGGVRTPEMIEKLLGLGISRVVLGTQAIEDKEFLEDAFKRFKDRVIVSLDAKVNRLLIRGWQKSSGQADILKFAQGLKKIGFRQLIYTDILKDGTLKGPNIKTLRKLLKETKMQVIASGGVSSLKDIYRLRLLEGEGLIGVIVGKALYEGRFTLAEALKFA